tara:strand:- start:134 stop:3085 length:2952 start_codon:yes stop_codon:yes gene_type:complete
MLAESLLLPARLGFKRGGHEPGEGSDSESDEPVAPSALDSIWDSLGEAKATRASNPRALAGTTRATAALYAGGRALSGAVDVLRSRPEELVTRLEQCLEPSDTDDATDDDDDETEAHRLAAEANALAVLASETLAARRGGDVETSAVGAAIKRWCVVEGRESVLLRWVRRWTKPRRAAGVFAAARSRAHAVALRAAAYAERAAATRAAAGFGASPSHDAAASLPDATLETNALASGRALLSHAAAVELLAQSADISGNVDRVAVLEAVAAAAESSAAAANSSARRSLNDLVGRVLDAARELRLERAILAPPPPGLWTDGAPEYGGDFLWDASWVERATGGGECAGEDVGWGAPEGPLAKPGREAAAALRVAGRVASRASAQLAALSSAVDLLAAAAGPSVADPRDFCLASALDDVPQDLRGSLFHEKPAELLSSWSVHERAAAARAALGAFDDALEASDEEGAEHFAALAAELADAVALLVRVWASAVDTDDPPESSEAFEMARATARAAARALSRRGDGVAAGSAQTTAAGAVFARPLLSATTAAIRAWRITAEATAPTARLVEGAELGQRLLPLMHMLCAAAATPFGGQDGALALGLLHEMCDGLLSPSALAGAAKQGAPFLPPLVPPRRRHASDRGAGKPTRRNGEHVSAGFDPDDAAARGSFRTDEFASLGVHSFVSLPFAEFMDDAPVTALQPFLDAANADAAARADANRAAKDASKRALELDNDHGVHSGGVEVPAALALCLHLARHPEGADALRRANLLERLGVLCEQLSDNHHGENGYGEYAYDPATAYRLALRVAATLAGAAEGSGVEAGELRDALVAFATGGSLPNRLENALRPCEITTDSLSEAEASAGFFHAVASVGEASWQITAPKRRARARAAATEFLQWVANPPSRRGAACAPRTDRERFAASSPARVGCATGWFHCLSVGSSSVGSAAIAAAVAASSDASMGNKHSEALVRVAFPKSDTHGLRIVRP